MSQLEYETAYETTGGATVAIGEDGTVKSVTRKYFFLRDPSRPAAGRDTLDGVSGLPRTGDQHPQYAYLVVTELKALQGAGGAALRWDVDVEYASPGQEDAEAGEGGEPEQAEVSREYSYEEIMRDLTADAGTGAPLLNSAGDLFDSVPQRKTFAPCISLAIKSDESPAALAAYNGRVNDAALTVDGFTFARHCCLCRVRSETLYSDARYKFQHTIDLIGATNPVKLDHGDTGATDVGWDYAILDAGFRYLDAGGDPVRASEVDEETGESRPSQKPVPLDGAGGLAAPGEFHFIRVSQYPEADMGHVANLFRPVVWRKRTADQQENTNT